MYPHQPMLMAKDLRHSSPFHPHPGEELSGFWFWLIASC
jgi:hypothetical protein